MPPVTQPWRWVNYPGSGALRFDEVPWWQWWFKASAPGAGAAPPWGTKEYWAWKTANDSWRQKEAERRAKMIARNMRDLESRYLRLIDAIIHARWLEAKYLIGRDLSKSIRIAQLNLARANTGMWDDILKLLEQGYGEASWLGSQSSTILTDYLVRNSRGIDADFWWRSIQAQSRIGLMSARSKRLNDIRLAELVYRNGQKSIKAVNKIIKQGLKDGLNHKELQKLLLKHMNPNTPGGPRYAARRLARTEIGNAFHRSSTETYKNQPWLTGVKWHLSGTHAGKKADQCDTYANSVHTRGGERGVFKQSEVPGKPHPQCMCFITPVVMDQAEFEKKFFTVGQFVRLWLKQKDAVGAPLI